jgi:hypothetical protein
LYLSGSCNTDYWNYGDRRKLNWPTHKQLYAHNKRHMEKLPETQAVLKMFPVWGRLEKDGTFSFDLARARFGVLGGIGFGY